MGDCARSELVREAAVDAGLHGGVPEVGEHRTAGGVRARRARREVRRVGVREVVLEPREGVQVTAEADMYSTAKALAIAIRRRCESFRGGLGGVTFYSVFVENETDGWADFGAPPAPVVRIDLMVTHSEV